MFHITFLWPVYLMASWMAVPSRLMAKTLCAVALNEGARSVAKPEPEALRSAALIMEELRHKPSVLRAIVDDPGFVQVMRDSGIPMSQMMQLGSQVYYS